MLESLSLSVHFGVYPHLAYYIWRSLFTVLWTPTCKYCRRCRFNCTAAVCIMSSTTSGRVRSYIKTVQQVCKETCCTDTAIITTHASKMQARTDLFLWESLSFTFILWKHLYTRQLENSRKRTKGMRRGVLGWGLPLIIAAASKRQKTRRDLSLLSTRSRGEKTMRQITEAASAENKGRKREQLLFIYFRHNAAQSGLSEKDICLLNMIAHCRDPGMICRCDVRRKYLCCSSLVCFSVSATVRGSDVTDGGVWSQKHSAAGTKNVATDPGFIVQRNLWVLQWFASLLPRYCGAQVSGHYNHGVT